jgi:hypothetical protein
MKNKTPKQHIGTGLKQAILPAPMPLKPVHPKYVSIQTTLFDLIHAMQTEPGLGAYAGELR